MKGHSRSFNPSQILRNLPRAARLLLCAMIAMLCAAYVAKAQDTGYISGTVTDKTGAAVVAAEVVISSTSGSATHATTTNADGAFVVAGLPGGNYNVVVTAKGFSRYSAIQSTTARPCSTSSSRERSPLMCGPAPQRHRKLPTIMR